MRLKRRSRTFATCSSKALPPKVVKQARKLAQKRALMEKRQALPSREFNARIVDRSK